MLQAFIDDSEGQSADRPLVLAGYLHSAEEWIAFSDAWDAALHAHPRIKGLHMVEAHRLRGEFEGWTEDARTRKLFKLAEIIADFRPFSIACSLSAKSHTELLKPYAPYGLSDRYFPLVFTVACGFARLCHAYGAHVPIDFIFDRQDNVSKHVNLFWDYIVGGQPKEWGSLIQPTPMFRDDDNVKPLQAADMLAWNVRRFYEGNYPSEYDRLRDLLCYEGYSYTLEITDDYLRRWGEKMQQLPNVKDVLTKPAWDAAMQQIIEDGFPTAQHRIAIEGTLGRG